jgi:hypothetical protein
MVLYKEFDLLSVNVLTVGKQLLCICGSCTSQQDFGAMPNIISFFLGVGM